MKKSGKCPKCGGDEIYTDDGLMKRGERTAIGLSSWTRLFIATYVCAGCGFLEEYADSKELSDPKKMSSLREKWSKHHG